jgi:hypothetical protein
MAAEVSDDHEPQWAAMNEGHAAARDRHGWSWCAGRSASPRSTPVATTTTATMTTTATAIATTDTHRILGWRADTSVTTKKVGPDALVDARAGQRRVLTLTSSATRTSSATPANCLRIYPGNGRGQSFESAPVRRPH